MLEKWDKKELLNKLDKKELLDKFGKKNLLIAASVAVVLLIGVMAYLSSPGHRYAKELKTAQKSFARERYEEAVTAYQTAYGIYSEEGSEKAKAVLADMAGSYDKLITSQLESGLYEEAGATFEAAGNAIATVNSNEDAIMECAQGCTWLWDREKLDLYIAVGEADSMAAEEEYAKACTQYEELWNTIYGRTEEYIPELKERIKTGVEANRFTLAEQYIAKKQYTLAGKQYDGLLAIAGDNEKAHTGRINMYLYENDVVAAIEQLEKAEKACPNEKWQEWKDYIIANSSMVSKKKYNAEDGKKGELQTTWEYNENGDVIKELAQGRVKEFTYDESGKLTMTNEEWFVGKNTHSTITSFLYDEQGRVIEEKIEYNKIDTNAPQSITTSTYEYYDNGRQKSEKVVQVADSEEQILRDNIWDENGKPLRESLPDGIKDFTYRDDGTLLTTTATYRGTEDKEIVSYNTLGVPVHDGKYRSWNYEYNEEGELTSRWRDGEVATYEYDEKHRLIHYLYESEAHVTLANLPIYNDSQFIGGSKGTTGYKREEYEFSYDDKGRVTEQYFASEVEKYDYERREKGISNGMVYSDTTGKGVWVATSWTETVSSYITDIEYVECEPDDVMRITSPWERYMCKTSNFIQLTSCIPESDGFRFVDYYRYNGNWKSLSYTRNGEKNGVWQSGEDEEVEVDGEKDAFGNIVKPTSGETGVIYEYKYIFEGKIE